MSDEKVVSITDSGKTRTELSLREAMIRQGIHNYILESCGNSPSLGYGTAMDSMAVRVEIKLFNALLEAYEENVNFDSEIFFDSFIDDLQLLYKKFHGEYRKYQEVKLMANIDDSSNK